jgi:hypothetical protein
MNSLSLSVNSLLGLIGQALLKACTKARALEAIGEGVAWRSIWLGAQVRLQGPYQLFEDSYGV